MINLDKKKAWYKRSLVINSAIIFLPPVGLGLVFASDWRKRWKVVGGGIAGLMTIGMFAPAEPEKVVVVEPEKEIVEVVDIVEPVIDVCKGENKVATTGTTTWQMPIPATEDGFLEMVKQNIIRNGDNEAGARRIAINDGGIGELAKGTKVEILKDKTRFGKATKIKVLSGVNAGKTGWLDYRLIELMPSEYTKCKAN